MVFRKSKVISNGQWSFRLVKVMWVGKRSLGLNGGHTVEYGRD